MSLTTHLTDCLVDTENIPNEEYEVIRYGVEGILNNLLGIFLTLTVGIFCDCVFESFIFWIFFWILRKHAGGFHAKTKIRCLIMSVVLLFIAFEFLLKAGWTIDVYTWIMVIGSGCIFYLAPVETHNKHLDEREVRVYRKRTRIILSIQLMLYFLSLILGGEQLCRILAVNVLAVNFSLVLGKILK